MIDTRKGFTLLELMVAIAVSGLVVSLAFGAWAAVERHSSRLDRSRLLDVETRRIATGIADELRRSGSVVRLGPLEIAFVSAVTFDTVEYRTDGVDMLKNNKPVQIRAMHSRVCEFGVEDCSRLQTSPRSEHLIRITLCLEDSTGNRARLSVDAAVHVEEAFSVE